MPELEDVPKKRCRLLAGRTRDRSTPCARRSNPCLDALKALVVLGCGAKQLGTTGTLTPRTVRRFRRRASGENVKTSCAFLVLAILAVPASAAARDDRLLFSIADAMSTPAAKAKLDPKVKLYFGTKTPAPVATTMGEVSVSRKTNAFGKTDLAACQWVFLSVVLELQDQARKAGGDAVIEIETNYKHEVMDSPTEFGCGAGAIIAGVALRGKVAKLAVEAPPVVEQK
jgi:hypothetical protein